MSAKVNIKVCGMTQLDNIKQVESLAPAYIGFIFYENSPRNVELKSLQEEKVSKRVGVFVNANLMFIEQKIADFNLDVIQLHGEESVGFCKSCQEKFDGIEVWKVFGLDHRFNFDPLREYVPFVDAFLFDTKTEARGGSGKVFNWQVLKSYPFETPIIISGGIGIEQIEVLKSLLECDLPIKTIDVNSRFELSPGIKDYKKLKTFFDGI